MKNINIEGLKRTLKKGIVLVGMVSLLSGCGSKEETKNMPVPTQTVTITNDVKDDAVTADVETKEEIKKEVKEVVTVSGIEDTTKKSFKSVKSALINAQKNTKETFTAAPATEAKKEVSANSGEENLDIESIRESYKLSTADYEKAYANFYNIYGKDEQLLNINSVDAIVYYMNAGSLTEQANYEIAGKYVVNDSQAIIDDMSIAREDIINYNINALMAGEVAPVYISEAVAKEDQKATVKYIESLIEKIANGKDKEEKLNALKEFHSIIMYGDADLANETNTEKYDGVKYNELTAQQQFAISTIYIPEVNVLAGVQGIDFTTYFNDVKSNAIKDMSDYIDTLPNPLSKEGCKELVIK